MPYDNKSSSGIVYISSIVNSLNPLIDIALANIGKSHDVNFLKSQGVIEAILTFKDGKHTSTVLAIPMLRTKSYHCINYTQYPKEPRFFNASIAPSIPVKLGLIGNDITKENQNPIYLVEGVWDYLVMKKYGYDEVFGLPGVNNFSEEWLDFQGKIVYLCFDNDKTGKEYAMKHATTLSKIAKEIKIIKLPEKLNNKDTKDISDLFNALGSGAKNYLDELILSAEKYEYDIKFIIREKLHGKGNGIQKSAEIASRIIEDLEVRHKCKLIPYNDYQEFAIVVEGKNIIADSAVSVFLAQRYNYLESEYTWKLIRNILYVYAVNKETINLETFNDYKDDKCYIGIKNKGVLVIDRHCFYMEDQGVDNHYLRSSGLVYLNGTLNDDVDISFESLLDMFNFETPEQKFLVKIWFYQTFFDPENRPILAICGDHGTGKTLLQKIMKGILFGFKNANPNTIPEEDYQFSWMTKEYKYLFLDEVNESNPQMKARLRVLVTGEEAVFRPKYARNVIRFKPKVFLSISAHSPKFRDPDIAQRLCLANILPFCNRGINEKKYLEYLEQHREKILDNFYKKIQEIVNNIYNNKNDEIQLSNYCRQMEMAEFAWKAFPDERDVCLRTFESMNYEQTRFSVEYDPIIDIVESWIGQQKVRIEKGDKFLSKEIHERLSGLANQKGIKTLPVSVAGMGRYLSHRKEILGKKYGMKIIKNTHLKQSEYTFDINLCQSIKDEI